MKKAKQLKQMKIYKKIALALSFFFGLTFYALPASALNMSNSNFTLQMGNINSFSGKKSNGNYVLNDTGGQIAPGLFSGPNYQVKAGFQYVSSIINFRFSISSNFIDFGLLQPTDPITRTQTLTVSNGSAYGYAVDVAENHALLVPSSGAVIPDTTCDGGTCSDTTASAWSNVLTYGFGYRCDNISGTDCSSDFSNSAYYKSFANLANNQTPQAVMSSLNVGKNRQVTITYKVNTSASQSPGNYVNLVRYVATPTY